MAIIRRHTYTGMGKITAECYDPAGFLWVAFLGADNECHVYKLGMDAETRYFDITVTSTEVKKMKVDDSYLYMAFNDDVYIGARFDKTDPLGSYDYIAIPAGIDEKAVDLAMNPTYDDGVWALITPGELSAEDSNVIFITDDTYTETLSLTRSAEVIRNLSSITFNPNTGEFWAVTDTDPIKLVRIYDDGGWVFDTTEVT